ncbi:hypothetical protein K6119_01275 [Paracrocinitomix mangrovi]|uniref:hypothetical protein n=1 Tax=Paracrocinitomix mangrovi TaxID=2862509 RepID=UPI001C8D486B|nr:hypothetical protein [Paracrocinitomix mangrovi]UKN02147.1 hypothetical protein K6119_01275 [Paracrocinitomix mangrovi]
MKTILHPYFILIAMVYLAVQLIFYLGYSTPNFISNYLSDLLCMPIILTLITAFTRLVKRTKELELSILSIAVVVLYWSMYFEWYLPTKSGVYTADLWDVVCYITGTTIFIVWRKSTIKRVTQEA